MPNITESSDGGSNPNTPTVAQMRESQRRGSTGGGTQSEDYADMQACFNMGTGDDDAADENTTYSAQNVSEPWE